MKYNIIGDIHSRTNWKKLLKDDCINIFVGDYFSPYFPYSFEEQVNVFMDIILYNQIFVMLYIFSTFAEKTIYDIRI